MNGEIEIYSFRANNKEDNKVQNEIKKEEYKEDKIIQIESTNVKLGITEKTANNDKCESKSGSKEKNIFQIDEPNSFINKLEKEEKKIKELVQAPEYINTRKEIVSSPNLMLLEKKRPIKKMLLKSHSIHVEPTRSKSSTTCPQKKTNEILFKFAVNMEERAGRKTEKSLDTIRNSPMKQHFDASKVSSKFSNNKSKSDHKQSDGSIKSPSILMSNPNQCLKCNTCFVF